MQRLSLTVGGLEGLGDLTGAAFGRAGAFVLVAQVILESREQKGAKPAFSTSHAPEEIMPQQVFEEALDAVFGILWLFAPAAQPHDERGTVGEAEGIQGGSGVILGPQHQGPLRVGKESCRRVRRGLAGVDGIHEREGLAEEGGLASSKSGAGGAERMWASLPCQTAPAGIQPAVKPGVVAGGWHVGLAIRLGTSGAGPGGKMPPSTAGKMPAATWRECPDAPSGIGVQFQNLTGRCS